MRNLKLFAAGLALLAAPLPGAVQAADFSGKTIEFVVPFPTAGGSDVWARFFAPFLADQLPGKPTVVVKNVPGGGSTRKKSGKASTVSCTAADLPTTNAVGDGILVQCVQEKSKLRARVVSDGYDPNFNMRFPRSIREVGVLYVVDEVILGPGGNSYIACGDIKRLIQ